MLKIKQRQIQNQMFIKDYLLFCRTDLLSYEKIQIKLIYELVNLTNKMKDT